MKLQDWLNEYGYAVAFKRRGIAIERNDGEARYHQLFPEMAQVTRHIGYHDLIPWIKAQIQEQTGFITDEAAAEFKRLF